MGLLDAFIKVVQGGGTGLPSRQALNFVTGFSVSDNPSNNSIDITAAGAAAISSFSSGTPTLALNATNELSGTVSAATLPAGATSGDTVVIVLRALASDIVVTRSGSNTINGATTYTLKGTENPYAHVELKYTASNIWVVANETPQGPTFVLPADVPFNVLGTAGTGTAVQNRLEAADAATGAFVGGGWDILVGAGGDTTHHPGDINFYIGRELAGGDLKSGSFGILSDPGTGVYSDLIRIRSYFAGADITWRGGSIQLGAGTIGQYALNATNYIRESCVERWEFHNTAHDGVGAVEFKHTLKERRTLPNATPVTNILPYTVSGSCVVDICALVIFRNPTSKDGARIQRRTTLRFDGTSTWVAVDGAAADNGGLPDRVHASLAGVAVAIATSTATMSLTVTGIAAALDAQITVSYEVRS